jgi:hypothetical protein
MNSAITTNQELFYVEMDAIKLHRLQSEHMAVWDEFRQHATAQNKWRDALRMMINDHRSFAEAAAFVGYPLPVSDLPPLVHNSVVKV